MLRAFRKRTQTVPTWWLEPALAALLFALVIGTSIGFGVPAHAWVANVLICVGAALSAIFPWPGAALTFVGLLTQLTVDPSLIGSSRSTSSPRSGCDYESSRSS